VHLLCSANPSEQTGIDKIDEHVRKLQRGMNTAGYLVGLSSLLIEGVFSTGLFARFASQSDGTRKQIKHLNTHDAFYFHILIRQK
jgi:hypothetical protein